MVTPPAAQRLQRSAECSLARQAVADLSLNTPGGAARVAKRERANRKPDRPSVPGQRSPAHRSQPDGSSVIDKAGGGRHQHSPSESLARCIGGRPGGNRQVVEVITPDARADADWDWFDRFKRGEADLEELDLLLP